MQGPQIAVNVPSPVQSNQFNNQSTAVGSQGESFKGMVKEAMESLKDSQLPSDLSQQFFNIDENLDNSFINWELLQSLLAQNNGNINNVEVIEMNVENSAVSLLSEAEMNSFMQQAMHTVLNAEGKVIPNQLVSQNLVANGTVDNVKGSFINNQNATQNTLLNNEQVLQGKTPQQLTESNGKIVPDKATLTSQLESLKLNNTQMNGNNNAGNTEETKGQPELLLNQKPELLNPEKINIKVGNGNLQAENKQFANQMADKILMLKNGDKNEITLQLMPKELGKVTIRIIMDGNATQVLMTSTNAKAQNLLSLNAEGIRNIVETNTGTNVTVSVNEENKLNHQREAFDGRGEKQSREQQPEKKQESLDEDSAITFVNQLRLGLLSNTLPN